MIVALAASILLSSFLFILDLIEQKTILVQYKLIDLGRIEVFSLLAQNLAWWKSGIKFMLLRTFDSNDKHIIEYGLNVA